MRYRIGIWLMLVVVLLGSGCASVYRVRRPSTVVVATSQTAPAVYVAKTESAKLPGQELPKPELLQVGENGRVMTMGVVYNSNAYPIVLRSSDLEVCYGSELSIVRPKANDLCWKGVGAFQQVVVPPGGSSPWIRIWADGGFKVFVYQYALSAGHIAEQIVKLPVDFYAGDWVCPGNRLVDWYFVAGRDTNGKYGGIPYCTSTRMLR